MKYLPLNKRVEKLASKLFDPPKEHMIKIDPETFSGPEEALITTLLKNIDRYGKNLLKEVLNENVDLIKKAEEIVFQYACESFRFYILTLLGNPDNPADKLFFTIHFEKFLIVLKECLEDFHALEQSSIENSKQNSPPVILRE